MRTPAFNKYVWIINLLKTPLSLKEISDAWERHPRNNTKKGLNRSTFYYWKTTIESLYGVRISTLSMGKNATYVIESAPGKYNCRDWLLNTASVENAMMSNLDIRDRILLETIPSGAHCLQTILDAMHQNRCISFDYEDYWEDPVSVTIRPYFVKLFRQHWSVIGPVDGAGFESIRSYALDSDRMSNVRISDQSFKYPKNFDPDEFMENSIGAMTFPTKKSKPKKITILAWQKVNFYLKAVPLHPSQIMLEDVPEDGYSIFQYTLHPSDDFYQEICRYQEFIEVLSPADVRNEMISIIKRMQDEYDGVSRDACKAERKAFNIYLDSGNHQQEE